MLKRSAAESILTHYLTTLTILERVSNDVTILLSLTLKFQRLPFFSQKPTSTESIWALPDFPSQISVLTHFAFAANHEIACSTSSVQQTQIWRFLCITAISRLLLKAAR
jgi:hypothetical protein